MKKGNGIRLIVWGSICVMLALLGVAGFVSYNNGYGKIGSVIKYTKPLVETFNNLNEVKRFNEADIFLEAKVDGNTIVVNYATAVVAATYTFEYELMGTERIITTSYVNNSINDQTSSFILRFMIDAVSVMNGHKELEVFNKYTLETFETTALIDGVNIAKSGNTTIARINIGKSVLDSNIPVHNTDTEYVNENDLTNMMSSLSETKSFIAIKNDIRVEILNKDTSYRIYAQDSSLEFSSNLYESIKTVIRTLLGEDVLDVFTEKYPSITTSLTFDNFTIVVGSTEKDETMSFDQTKSIIQIDILLQ